MEHALERMNSLSYPTSIFKVSKNALLVTLYPANLIPCATTTAAWWTPSAISVIPSGP